MEMQVSPLRQRSSYLLKALVFLMFAMFAMTTDSVGTVIPQVIKQFGLGLTAAGSFQYSSMAGIGMAAIGLGFLADRIGRKTTILIGLTLLGASYALFAVGQQFLFFVALLYFAGVGIGIFKAGALALIGDLSTSTREHASTMNLVEGFFGIGAIIGPAIVALLVQNGASWKWIYLVAAVLSALLLIATSLARFPRAGSSREQPARPGAALAMAGDRTAWFFGLALMLYVGAEAAVYVWAPTYFSGYAGRWEALALYSVSIFFVLRAVGRFVGAWLLSRFDWSAVLVVCSGAMALLFWTAVLGGREIAIFALPATGLFMSVLYPTINSTGISCYDKRKHGSIAGLLLFFTCVSAVAAPLAMGAIGDWLGNVAYSLALGALFASLLVALCGWNLAHQPFRRLLAERNRADYLAGDAGSGLTAAADVTAGAEPYRPVAGNG